MTTITVYTLDSGMIRGYEAGGHAGGRRIRGYDLVCCAVSALTQTGVNALCAVAGVTPDVQVRDGYLRCILPEGMSDQQQGDAQIILRTIMTGLTDIQKIYPNLIRIQQKEWRQADAYDESSALRA
ncbi:MAG: ribosomal-processing cysteine protease Prp [Clostridia bacterium]|nr:ribosomal-processing cysteine protease Prp [Clostridia bacterium]MBQ2947482.1 ribosomal-processing cysteine protease Prp [Clostridia bacterium]